MAISTYSELKTAISDFLNRDDLTSAIPNFIALAEADFKTSIRHWRGMDRKDGNLDSRYTGIPDGFLKFERLAISTASGNRPLQPVSVDAMADERARLLGQAGEPRMYCLTGGVIEVCPSPDAAYPLEMTFHKEVPALSDAAPTNWLLTAFPNIYLYQSLIHSAPYLQEDGRIAVWGALAKSSIDALNADDMASRYGGTGLRMRTRVGT